jgi:hypothetical protein
MTETSSASTSLSAQSTKCRLTKRTPKMDIKIPVSELADHEGNLDGNKLMEAMAKKGLTVYGMTIAVIRALRDEYLKRRGPLDMTAETVAYAFGPGYLSPFLHIYINGRKHEHVGLDISYEAVIQMAGFRPGRILSVTYSTRRKGDEQRSGCLTPHKTIKVENDMVFDVGDTSNA